MITSLNLGLLAAICWGIHDICVRYVRQRTGIMAAIFTVLLLGAVILTPICLYYGDWSALTQAALLRAALSGGLFALASIGLYKAFAIGPVRLVAPIIGSFPILSVGLAFWFSSPVSLLQLLAVLVILVGVSIVAQSEDGAQNPARRAAIFWAIAAAIGFFGSFASGQSAAALGAELPVIWFTRIAAILVILAIALPMGNQLMPQTSHLYLLALMGLLDATALAFVIFAGTQEFSAFATVTASTFGLVTIVLARFFLKEPMTGKQWTGALLVFASVCILSI